MREFDRTVEETIGKTCCTTLASCIESLQSDEEVVAAGIAVGGVQAGVNG